MLSRLKLVLYFPLASYFRFFAKIRLKRWNPRIVIVTGSSGKTTLLHMLEAQIGDKAKYSHHANTSFGIPFDILGLRRETLLKSEWIGIILKTPFAVFKALPKQKLYIVEADASRPKEGRFLGELLKPEVVVWTSLSRTHRMRFEKLVESGKFSTIEEAIAFEFGYYLEHCSKLSILNGDEELAVEQKNRTKAEVKLIKKDKIFKKYELRKDGTYFEISEKKYFFPYILPEEVFYAIEMCRLALNYLQLTFDPTFKKFQMPPSRGSIFSGIKNITIIDSCYNASLSSMTAVLETYKKFPAKNKWIVIGDMLEMGKGEKEEHEKLAEFIAKIPVNRIILLGTRVSKYSYPKLQQLISDEIPIDTFINPRKTLDFIKEHLEGEETILFKGARFMEGIIEHLLVNKKDVEKLARREKIWEIRRRRWGL